MSDSKVRVAMRAYVRSLFSERRAKGVSFRDIGTEFGVSGSWVVQFLDPATYGDKSVGQKVEEKLAAKLHGGSIDALHKAALQFLLEQPAPGQSVELDPRYPNRSRAIAMACEGLDITPAQAERLAPVALDADEDQPVFWWLDQIRSAHQAEKKGFRLGLREVDPSELD